MRWWKVIIQQKQHLEKKRLLYIFLCGSPCLCGKNSWCVTSDSIPSTKRNTNLRSLFTYQRCAIINPMSAFTEKATGIVSNRISISKKNGLVFLVWWDSNHLNPQTTGCFCGDCHDPVMPGLVFPRLALPIVDFAASYDFVRIVDRQRTRVNDAPYPLFNTCHGWGISSWGCICGRNLPAGVTEDHPSFGWTMSPLVSLFAQIVIFHAIGVCRHMVPEFVEPGPVCLTVWRTPVWKTGPGEAKADPRRNDGPDGYANKMLANAKID